MKCVLFQKTGGPSSPRNVNRLTEQQVLALKPVIEKFISKSEYWEMCAPHIRAEHEARSAAELEGVIVTAQRRAARSVANKAREAEGEA